LAELGLDLQNGGIGDINVLLGNGDGTFQGARVFPLPSSSLQFAASISADLNGDKKPDLVILQDRSAAITVLLGNGDGTFQSPVSVQTGLSSFYGLQGVGVGDFNNDGKLDLVAVGIVTFDTNNYTVFTIILGYGDGTFDAPTAPVILPAALPDATAFPIVALADFNKDGKLDMAICGQSAIMTMLGKGGGSFQPATVTPTGCENVIAGDFNNDKKIDLALLGVNGGLYVMLGVGDGTFQPPIYTSAGFSMAGVRGDFNRDGKQDLAIIVGSNVSVFLGNGDGTFQAPQSFSAGQTPVGLATLDLNGDGKLDLVVTDAATNSVKVLLGNGDGTFGNPAPYTLGGSFGFYESCPVTGFPACSFTPALADFNSDGAPDVASLYSGIHTPDSLEMLLNTGGTFITLTSSQNPSVAGQPVTFTALVSQSIKVMGQPQPVGYVTFADGTTVLGTGTLAAGVARVTMSNLSSGSHSITATYSGNKYYNKHRSASLVQSVH